MKFKLNKNVSDRIDDLSHLMKSSEVNFLSYESEGVKIQMKSNVSYSEMTSSSQNQSPIDETSEEDDCDVIDDSNSDTDVISTPSKIIKSPRVGYFYYISPKNEKIYASENQSINEGDVLGVIISMKAEYPIKSNFSGTVKKILVDNAQPVEFAQPLFEIL